VVVALTWAYSEAAESRSTASVEIREFTLTPPKTVRIFGQPIPFGVTS
jgi:hypothetical protein